MKGEEVLVVKTSLLHEIGYFQGLQRVDKPSITESRFAPLFDPANQSFMERSAAEHDPSWKQLIPYVLISVPKPSNKGNYALVNYFRGAEQGEQRLHGKRSIGIGGHINPVDASRLGLSAYKAGLRREMEEELDFEQAQDVLRAPVVAFINDDSTEVGKVHFGVVHFWELPNNVQLRSKELVLNYGYLDALCDHREDFESWSQLCLDMLKEEYVMAKMAAKTAILDMDTVCRTTR